jgi:hypothetical protein
VGASAARGARQRGGGGAVPGRGTESFIVAGGVGGDAGPREPREAARVAALHGHGCLADAGPPKDGIAVHFPLGTEDGRADLDRRRWWRRIWRSLHRRRRMDIMEGRSRRQ